MPDRPPLAPMLPPAEGLDDSAWLQRVQAVLGSGEGRPSVRAFPWLGGLAWCLLCVAAEALGLKIPGRRDHRARQQALA